MTTPKMIQWLLRRLAGLERADDVLGDFEEAHLRRIGRRGRLLGTVLTGLAAVDMAVALLRGVGAVLRVVESPPRSESPPAGARGYR